MKILVLLGFFGLFSSFAFGGVRSHQKSAFLGECTNFSGTWTGICSFGSLKGDAGNPATMLIEQNNCEQIKTDEVTYSIGRSPATHTEDAWFQTMEWNKDKTVLTGTTTAKNLKGLKKVTS